MKSHAFRRGLLVAAVYLSVVLALVLIQFSRNTGFTFNVGSIAVTGKYEQDSEDGAGKTERRLSGPVGLFYGGMEFHLAESDGLAAVRAGRAAPVKPSSLSLTESGISVRLSDGSELRFAPMFLGGEETLRATAAFARGTTELRVPYRPMRSFRVTDLGGGNRLSSRRRLLHFSSALVDPEKRVVALRTAAPALSRQGGAEEEGILSRRVRAPFGRRCGVLRRFRAAVVGPGLRRLGAGHV
jgi:hypothetical protein